MMFARLLQANADRTKVGPGLAKSWEISDDGKTYTFHLVDAKFSDGSPITAEHVAFSYTCMRFQKDSAYAAPFQPLVKAEAKDPQDRGHDPRPPVHALPHSLRNLEHRHRAEGRRHQDGRRCFCQARPSAQDPSSSWNGRPATG